MNEQTLSFLGPMWGLLGLVILVSGVRAQRSERALAVGCAAVAVLWVVGGACVNAGVLALGTFSGFADGSSLDFVQDTWESLVVPHDVYFIGLLIAFEALAGTLALVPGRPRQVALAALIGFNVLLLPFGWGFVLWAVPVGTGLALLLRAELHRDAGHESRELVGAGRHALR